VSFVAPPAAEDMFGISSANPFWTSVHGGPKCHPQAFVPDAKILLHPTPNVDLWKGKADPALPKPDSSTTVPFLNLLKGAREKDRCSLSSCRIGDDRGGESCPFMMKR